MCVHAFICVVTVIMGSSGVDFGEGRCSRGGGLLGVDRWLSVSWKELVSRREKSDGSGAIAAQRSLLEVGVRVEGLVSSLSGDMPRVAGVSVAQESWVLGVVEVVEGVVSMGWRVLLLLQVVFVLYLLFLGVWM